MKDYPYYATPARRGSPAALSADPLSGVKASLAGRQTSQRGFIANIAIVLVVLATVFLSQSPSFRPLGQKTYQTISKAVSPYTAQIGEWFSVNIYPRVSSEAQKRGAALQGEVSHQKDIAAQSLWEKIKSYFAEKFSKISGTKVE